MAGFFKRIVDKMSGYPEDPDADYDNDYGYEDEMTDHYDYGHQEAYAQQAPSYASAPYQQQPSQYGAQPNQGYSAPLRGPAAAPKVVPLKSNPGEHQLLILSPNNIQSAQKVCDHLRAGHTVICNIENTDPKVAQRIIDFITGSTYAMDGNVKPIDARAHTFVAVPRNVSLVDREMTSPRETLDYADPFRMAR